MKPVHAHLAGLRHISMRLRCAAAAQCLQKLKSAVTIRDGNPWSDVSCFTTQDAEESEQRKNPISKHTTMEDCIQYAGIYAWPVHISTSLYNAQHKQAAVPVSNGRSASQQYVC